MLVLFEWAWAYVTYQRGARLITEHVYERWKALWQDAPVTGAADGSAAD